MKLGEKLLKHLSKKYEPSRMAALRFGRYDMAMKTNEVGNPILAFVGKADEQCIIKGDQYARRLLEVTSGSVIKEYRVGL